MANVKHFGEVVINTPITGAMPNLAYFRIPFEEGKIIKVTALPFDRSDFGSGDLVLDILNYGGSMFNDPADYLTVAEHQWDGEILGTILDYDDVYFQDEITIDVISAPVGGVFTPLTIIFEFEETPPPPPNPPPAPLDTGQTVVTDGRAGDIVLDTVAPTYPPLFPNPGYTEGVLNQTDGKLWVYDGVNWKSYAPVDTVASVAWSMLQTPGLTGFFEADNLPLQAVQPINGNLDDLVEFWLDKSAADNNFSPETLDAPYYKPNVINGLPAVRIPDASRRLTGSQLQDYFTFASHTVLMVARFMDLSQNLPYTLLCLNDFAGIDLTHTYTYENFQTYKIMQTCGAARVRGLEQGRFYLFQSIQKAGMISLRVDDMQSLEVPFSDFNTNDYVALGGANYTTYGDIEIAALVTSNVGLSGLPLARVRKYLKDKYFPG